MAKKFRRNEKIVGFIFLGSYLISNLILYPYQYIVIIIYKEPPYYQQDWWFTSLKVWAGIQFFHCLIILCMIIVLRIVDKKENHFEIQMKKHKTDI